MAKKATGKKVAEKKVVEAVKEVKAVVAEEIAPVAEAAPVVEKAAPVAETEVKEKKKAGRKPGSKNKTTVAKEAVKETKKDEVFVQFAGEEFVVEEVMEKAKAAYVAEGHRVSAIKSVRLYIKPEERKAYYVINEKAAGSIDL